MKLSVYEQIVADIKHKIALGLYTEGERLPSCRDLGLQLGINPNTVQRAYSELEAAGVIFSIPKKGIYVRNDDVNKLATAEEKLGELKSAGLTFDECLDILKKIYEVKND